MSIPDKSTGFPELELLRAPSGFRENWSVEFQRYAFAKHNEQRDKYVDSGYYRHLVEVAALTTGYLFDYGASYNQIQLAHAVALGHDLVEDQGGLKTFLEIRDKFGIHLAMGILWLSDLEGGNREERKRLGRERIKNASGWVQLIKCCDLMSNLRTIVHHDPKFARTFIPEAFNLYKVMVVAPESVREDLRREIMINATLANITLEN